MLFGVWLLLAALISFIASFTPQAVYEAENTPSSERTQFAQAILDGKATFGMRLKVFFIGIWTGAASWWLWGISGAITIAYIKIFE